MYQVKVITDNRSDTVRCTGRPIYDLVGHGITVLGGGGGGGVGVWRITKYHYLVRCCNMSLCRRPHTQHIVILHGKIYPTSLFPLTQTE